MSLVVQVRRVLARRPWLYWAAVAVLALMAAVVVSRAAAAVESTKQAWGAPRTVLVAVRDVRPGDAVAGVTERRAIPAPAVPDRALSDVDDAALARQHIAAGEIVVEHDVLASAAPQAMIPDDWLAVALAESVPSGVRTGDAVGVASGGIVLAADALVVGVAGDAVLVAVPGDEAPQVAQAIATGDVALLIKG